MPRLRAVGKADTTRSRVGSTAAGVHYTVTGDGPRALVLLHGFGDNLTTWNRVVPALAVGYRVIAIDLPGFGRSARPWRSPLLDGYVDVVSTVLDAEGVDGPVSLMGNSMGAAVSLLFATRHPGQVEGIVLIDMPGLHAVPRLWAMAMSRPAELGLRAALRFVPAAVPEFGLGMFYGRIASARPRDLAPDVRLGFVSPYAERGGVAALLPIGRVLLRELRTAGLSTLVAGSPVPTMLVFGARDLLTPARSLRRVVRAGTDDGRRAAVVLPGCGHCPQVDQPEALLSTVLPFLRRSQAGDRAPATAVTA